MFSVLIPPTEQRQNVEKFNKVFYRCTEFVASNNKTENTLLPLSYSSLTLKVQTQFGTAHYKDLTVQEFPPPQQQVAIIQPKFVSTTGNHEEEDKPEIQQESADVSEIGKVRSFCD